MKRLYMTLTLALMTVLMLLPQPVRAQETDCEVQVPVKVVASAQSGSIEDVSTAIQFEPLDGAPAPAPGIRQELTGTGTLTWQLNFTQPGSWYYRISQSMTDPGSAVLNGEAQLESNPIILRVEVLSENGTLTPVMYGYRDQESARSDGEGSPQEKVSDLVFAVTKPEAPVSTQDKPDKKQPEKPVKGKNTSTAARTDAGPWLLILAAAGVIILLLRRHAEYRNNG